MIRETFPVGLLQCNCTLLGDETTREAILIDPGDDIPHILSLLQKHQLALRQILITHAHIDHIGAAARLRQITGAPILLHRADLPLLSMMETQAAWLRIPTPETVPPDESAEDGLKVGLPGLEAQVIHTPGHTQGSICLHFPAHNLLLSGDTLFAGSIGRTDLPGGDSRQILRSLRNRLLVLPEITHVVPGHGPETTLGDEREFNPFLQNL